MFDLYMGSIQLTYFLSARTGDFCTQSPTKKYSKAQPLDVTTGRASRERLLGKRRGWDSTGDAFGVAHAVAESPPFFDSVQAIDTDSNAFSSTRSTRRRKHERGSP